MVTLLIALGVAEAHWPTRTYAFFPVPSSMFDDGDMVSVPIPGRTWNEGSQVHLDYGIDYDQRNHVNAPNAIQATTDNVAEALIYLEAGGWNAPHVDPLVHTPDGQVRWGLLWFDGTMDTRFRYLSPYGQGPTDWLYVQGDARPKKVPLDVAFASDPDRVRNVLTYLLLHETVHAIQGTTSQGENVDEAKFLYEGVAEAVSLMLTEKRDPDLPDTLGTARMLRDMSVPFDGRTDLEDNALTYNAGALYRYLAEAHHGAFPTRLTLLERLVHAQPEDVQSRGGAYALVQEVIGDHIPVTMHPAVVFAEFLTEYASYGDSRYKGTKDVPLERFQWLEAVSPEGCGNQGDPRQCALTITKESPSDSVTLNLEPMSGQAVQLQWASIDAGTASSLQISIEASSKTERDALHIGEIRARDADGERFCYDVTGKVDQRLGKDPSTKCLLRRTGVDTADGRYFAHFALDKPPEGTGESWLMVVNAGEDFATTPAVKATVQVGRAEAKQAGRSMSPRTDGEPRHHGAAVEHGRVRSTDRLELAYMGEDSVLFDGLATSGEGEEQHFWSASAASAFEGQPEGTGVMLRAEEYMVVVMRGPDGGPLSGRHSAIIKDPEKLSSWNPLGLVLSVGSEAFPGTEECGFQTEIAVDELERTDGHVRYRLRADLFDPMRAAMGGEGCAALQAGWVETADIELVVPRPHLLEPGGLERSTSVIQAAYDEGFDGPMLGGIATAESLRADGPPPPGPYGDDNPFDGFPGVGGGGGGGGGGDDGFDLPGLDGDAARELLCLLPVREGDYEEVDPRVLDATVQALEASGCACWVVAASSHEDYADRVDPALLDALDDDDCGAVDVPGLEALAQQEASTLGALEAAGALLDGEGGLAEVRQLGDAVGFDMDRIPGFQTLESWWSGTSTEPEAAAETADDDASSCDWLHAGLEADGMALGALMMAAEASGCACALSADVARGVPASEAAAAALSEACQPD